MAFHPFLRFRTQVFFSRDYADLGKNIMDYSEDKEMLKSMVNIAQIADIGIADMKFEINNQQFADLDDLPDSFCSGAIAGIRAAALC